MLARSLTGNCIVNGIKNNEKYRLRTQGRTGVCVVPILLAALVPAGDFRNPAIEGCLLWFLFWRKQLERLYQWKLIQLFLML